MGFIGSKKSRLNYREYGSGSRVIFGFHGYGQNNDTFHPIKGAKLYSFDLPFHGQSSWENSNYPLSREWINNAFTKFLKENNIEKFSLLGFSLGCKFTQGILLEFPDRVENLYWIAPDGVYQNFWYMVATKFPGNYVYRLLILSAPGILLILSRLANKLGFIPDSAYKLSKSQLQDPEKRLRVYNTWMVTKKLSFSINTINQLLNKYSIETNIFLGTKDKIIDGKKVKKRMSNAKKIHITQMDRNHFNLLDDSLKSIEELVMQD